MLLSAMNEKKGYPLSERTQGIIRKSLGLNIKVVNGGSEKDFNLFTNRQVEPRAIDNETQSNDKQ